jgi:hypothetical protein
MDLNRMLTELREQRERLNRVIMAVEDYARVDGPRRRGRPPKWMTQAKRRGRPPGSKNHQPVSIAV